MTRIIGIAVFIVAAYLVYKLASVKLKNGAAIENASWRMFWVAIIADGIFKKHGTEAIITSGSDGKHSARSKHYPENNASGQVEALDLRTWHVDPHAVAADMREKLGANYDVVVESDHLHIEYDPKA